MIKYFRHTVSKNSELEQASNIFLKGTFQTTAGLVCTEFLLTRAWACLTMIEVYNFPAKTALLNFFKNISRERTLFT
jgi:hypothetical protein